MSRERALLFFFRFLMRRMGNLRAGSDGWPPFTGVERDVLQVRERAIPNNRSERKANENK